jgi:tetratricopeptide (TPR) repeat protein
LILVFSPAGFAADTTPAPAPAPRTEETNIQETLRSYLQLQEQLHATQLAIERNRKEAEAAAADSAKVFSARLQGIEQAIASQRAQEFETMQHANRVMLIVAGLFAAVGFAAMVFMAYFQWRTINRLAEISAALPYAHNFSPAASLAALGASDARLLAAGPAEQSNQRLLGALDQLEKRISQLEQPAPAPAPNGAPPDQELAPTAVPPSNGDAADAPEAARIAMLLGKGLSHLNLDQPAEALDCFDQVLELDPNHSEALVRRGAALERLRRLDEAIACYDRAIEADSSLTVAYLYKGGLFNRMERFGEALECYEQALRTQETRRG